jgi:hypothetical protein
MLRFHGIKTTWLLLTAEHIYATTSTIMSRRIRGENVQQLQALIGHCAGSHGNWSNGGLWMHLATLQGNEHSPTDTCSKPELLQNNILKQSML